MPSIFAWLASSTVPEAPVSRTNQSRADPLTRSCKKIEGLPLSKANCQLSNSDDDFVANCAPQADAYKKISSIEEIVGQSDNHLC